VTIDLRNWTESEQELHARLVYLNTLLFSEYVPGRDQPSFEHRLQEWLNGPGNEEDQRLLFSLLGHLYFIGQRELDVLYRKAFRADVMWWLAPAGVMLDDQEFDRKLDQALSETWFCPITDSMNIAHFHHVNGIRDRNLRPEWRTLAMLGDKDRVRDYMEKKNFRRLVLLEDFVGTGNQARDSIEWTLENFPNVPLLVCPLIVCREGFDVVSSLVGAHPNSEVRPGIVVPDRCAIGLPIQPQEPEDFAELRDLLLRLVALVGASGDSEEEKAFGYGCIGALTVLFTNCPNNTPPVFHHSETSTWKPLFPRVVRA
jgi:hypothetical protein